MDNINIIILVIIAVICMSISSSGIGGYFVYNQSSQQTSQPSKPSQSPPPQQAPPPKEASPPPPPQLPKKDTSEDNIVRNCTIAPDIGNAIARAFLKKDQTPTCTSFWDCNVGNLKIDHVGIWWSHTKGAADWACNSWVKDCNGNCESKYNRQGSTPMLSQIEDMRKNANTPEEKRLLKEAEDQYKETPSDCKLQ